MANANMTFKSNLLPSTNLGYNLGSSDKKWNVYGDLAGNATSATKLATARTISLIGSVTGSGSFDGSGNLSISTSTNHTHGNLVWRASFAKGSNPASATWPFGSWAYGSGSGTAVADRLLGFEGLINTDGATGIYLRAYQNVSGSSTAHTFGINAGKDGSCSYTISAPDKFRSAISTPSTTGAGASGTWGISVTGNAATATIPYGFSARGSGGWGLQTGTNVTDWQDSTGGDIDFRRDCPTSGQISIKVDGRFYCNEGNYICTWASNGSQIGSASQPVYVNSSGQVVAGNTSFPPTSHTHDISQISWAGSSNLACNGANTEWSIDMQSSATGSYWHVWSGVHGASCLQCWNSDRHVWAYNLQGAVWNDYAEYRHTDSEIEPGRCIREIGNDTLILTTERLMRGCEIVSDTYGFSVGKSQKNNTPTAASGRVLAYPYESLEEFKKHIGWPVCSGPNGTVSIMTEEEEEKYPSRIIGTISSVPDYEEWQCGDEKKPEYKKVNGRVWIRIR